MREGIHSDRPRTNFQRKISKENIRNNRLVGYSSCKTTWFWLSESRPPSRYNVRTWTEVWSLSLRDAPEILHFITNLYLFRPRPWLFSLKILFAWLLEATWKRRTLHYGNFLWYDLLFPGRNNKLLFWVYHSKLSNRLLTLMRDHSNERCRSMSVSEKLHTYPPLIQL